MYTIVARRWSSGDVPGDVDLIAWQGSLLCFVEVKTRTAHDMTPAESAVDSHKRAVLRRLARRYVRQFPLAEMPQVRFDVISVYLVPARSLSSRTFNHHSGGLISIIEISLDTTEACMDGVVTFLVTTNPEAAVRFYRDTLGWTFLRDDGFALVFDMKGVMLRIGQAKAFTPAENTVLGWESKDIAAAVDALVAKGVRFESYPNMGLDARVICTFPNGDKVAWFKDPDGNVLSLSQHAT